MRCMSTCMPRDAGGHGNSPWCTSVGRGGAQCNTGIAVVTWRPDRMLSSCKKQLVIATSGSTTGEGCASCGSRSTQLPYVSLLELGHVYSYCSLSNRRALRQAASDSFFPTLASGDQACHACSTSVHMRKLHGFGRGPRPNSLWKFDNREAYKIELSKAQISVLYSVLPTDQRDQT